MPVGRLRRATVVLALLLVAVLAINLVMALYGEWRVARATDRFEATLGTTDLSSLMLPEIPEAENAATWLQAGAAAVVLSDDQGEFSLSNLLDRQWSEAKTARARRFVEVNAPALELLRRAAGCSRASYGIDYRQGPETVLPDYPELIHAARLLWLDARLALAVGDVARLRVDLETLDRLAGSLAGESLLINAMLVFAVDRYGMDLVHRLVTGGTEDEALLAGIETALLARERQSTYLRALRADGSMIPAWELSTASPGWLRWLRRRLTRPVERLVVARLLDEYSGIGEIVSRPWQDIVATREEPTEPRFPDYTPVTFYTNLIHSVERLKEGQSTRQLAIEAVRQRRARLADGAYQPAPEAALVDPYSGRQVVIQRQPGGRLLIEAPGALELWLASQPERSTQRAPHFAWELPPTP